MYILRVYVHVYVHVNLAPGFRVASSLLGFRGFRLKVQGLGLRSRLIRAQEFRAGRVQGRVQSSS